VVEILRIGSTIMIVAACFQVFDALGISLVGALRGAGDTVVPGVVTMILSWTLIIGLGITIMRVAPGLGAIGPWIAAAVYIIVFGIWAGGRFWRGKWKSIRLIGEQGGVNP
jgi:MATE family multidrug resistance protein